MSIVEQMRLFMEPESIAIVGIPRRTGEGSLSTCERAVRSLARLAERPEFLERTEQQ